MLAWLHNISCHYVCFPFTMHNMSPRFVSVYILWQWYFRINVSNSFATDNHLLITWDLSSTKRHPLCWNQILLLRDIYICVFQLLKGFAFKYIYYITTINITRYLSDCPFIVYSYTFWAPLKASLNDLLEFDYITILTLTYKIKIRQFIRCILAICLNYFPVDM